MGLRWTAPAASDLYPGTFNKTMQLRPTRWQRLFTTACGSLSKFRYLDLGRNGRIPGSRELVFSGLPYVVVYHLQGEVVELLRIYHGAEGLAVESDI